MIQPAINMFTTNPQNKLATFEESLANKIKGEGDSALGDLKGKADSLMGDALGGLTDLLPPGLVDFTGERCINVPDFDIRFTFSLPDLTIGLFDLPCGLSDKINELLGDLESKMSINSLVKNDKGELLSMIKGSDKVEVAANQKVVKAFLVDASEVSEPEDDDMLTATAGGLIRQSTRFGMHDNVRLLFKESPKAVNLEMLQTYLLGSMRRALDAGDINTVNACTDITGGPALLTVYPDAIQAILKGYTKSEALLESEYVDEATRLIDCLDRIDPDWDKYQSLPIFNDQGTVDSYQCETNTVKPFLIIGDDAKLLLGGHERTMVSISILPMVQSMEIKSAVVLYYPYAAV